MSETAEVILGICVLLAVITLTRKYHTWRVKRGCILIGEALKAQGAFDAKSAIDLALCSKPSALCFFTTASANAFSCYVC